ncbi:hypothetical protein JJJ17_05890 [Paracoccus caeni]|uniref:Uncharacterized protein n=1 Tax=Paracoccus caeni TaxID=657651 RepID=A0A934SDN9_9RHOB|nr:hypothetical protein [Paracoccus caeni]MBK4215454.1 hypothetical protein [Paracoccus caeni]
MAFGFAVPAALGFLLLVGIVGSTYSGESFSESLVSLLFGDIRKTGAFLIIGLAQFLGLWLASMFGLVVGQHIAQPSVKTPEAVSTGGLSPVANEEPPALLSNIRQDDEPSDGVGRAPGTVRLVTLLTLISLALLFLFAYAAGRPIGFSGPVELIFPLFVATALGAWWATAIRSQPDRQQRARVAIWSTILGWLVIAAYWVFLVITVIGLSNLNEMQGLELDVTAVSLMIMTTTTLITLAITYAILEFGLWLGAWLARRR